MTDDAPKSFDFRNSIRLPEQVENRLVDWQSRSIRLLPQKWLSQLAVETQWTVEPPQSVNCKSMELPEHSVVYPLTLDEHQAPTLFVLPAEFAIAIVKVNLGESVESLGEPRETTSIETSILELLLSQTVDAINTSGKGVGNPRAQLGSLDPHPQMVRIYPKESSLISLVFQIQGPFGTSQLQWLWPSSLANELFLDSEAIYPADPRESADLQKLVLDMEMQVRVTLGSIEMPFSELAELRAGDLLVFDQPIAEPLSVRVADSTILRGWPTRTGNHQSVQIEECM